MTAAISFSNSARPRGLGLMDVSTAWLCSTLCPFSKAFRLHEAPPSPAACSGAWARLSTQQQSVPMARRPETIPPYHSLVTPLRPCPAPCPQHTHEGGNHNKWRCEEANQSARGLTASPQQGWARSPGLVTPSCAHRQRGLGVPGDNWRG